MTAALERATGGRAYTRHLAFGEGWVDFNRVVRAGTILEASAEVTAGPGEFPVSVSGKISIAGSPLSLVASGQWTVKRPRLPAAPAAV